MKQLFAIALLAVIIAGCNSNPLDISPLPDLTKMKPDGLYQANQYIAGIWTSKYGALADTLRIKPNSDRSGTIQVDSLQPLHYRLDSGHLGSVSMTIFSRDGHTRQYHLILSHLENGKFFVARGTREFFEKLGRKYMGWWLKSDH